MEDIETPHCADSKISCVKKKYVCPFVPVFDKSLERHADKMEFKLN